jgi:hypothetical protein
MIKPIISLSYLAVLLSASVHADDDWNFLVSPYLWFAGAKGDLSAIPGAPATSINVSPTNALKGTEASFMLMLEAKKRRHGVLLDIFYSDVIQEQKSESAGGLDYKASVQDTLVTLGYTYELYKRPHAVIDVIGGLRYWEVDTHVEFNSSTASSGDISVRNSESWADPLAGVKAKVRLGDSRFYLACYLGVGGLAGGSDSFYDLTANVAYQLSESVVTSIGYRVFDVDYEHDSFIYDVKQEGWMLGLVWIVGTNKLAQTVP